MSENLAAFLEARIAEDERYARAMQAAGERFRDSATPAQISRDTPLARELFDAMLDDPDAVAAMGAYQKIPPPNDLARVLREVEAKRKILALHTIRYVGTWPVCAHCRPVDPEFTDDLTSEPWPCRTLRLLAQVYSDHPDYAG